MNERKEKSRQGGWNGGFAPYGYYLKDKQLYIQENEAEAVRLSGILKCSKCGGPMYTNKRAWTNKDGTYKEIYYYVCSKTRTARGKICDYKAMLKKTALSHLSLKQSES